MNEPSDEQVKRALERGGLKSVDNLFYPGDSSRFDKLRSEYPKPEGTGRGHPSLRYKTRGSRKDAYAKDKYSAENETYIGTIESVRVGFLDTRFYTQDGKEFFHYGGETGAETYLIDRYWMYGDPPKKPLSIRFHEWLNSKGGAV